MEAIHICEIWGPLIGEIGGFVAILGRVLTTTSCTNDLHAVAREHDRLRLLLANEDLPRVFVSFQSR